MYTFFNFETEISLQIILLAIQEGGNCRYNKWRIIINKANEEEKVIYVEQLDNSRFKIYQDFCKKHLQDQITKLMDKHTGSTVQIDPIIDNSKGCCKEWTNPNMQIILSDQEDNKENIKPI